MTRFGTVLVANRGEIARRVISAARTAGLRSVAVYSDADRDAQHVREADAAVRIGPPPAAESYLSIPALLAAAARSGADAVHPGYGFLSERAEFARAVTDAGLVFIGPPADVIELMGRKDRARKVAAAAGVPVVPAAETQDAERLGEIAEQVGFPLLVKAAAGGGGKGMRVVRAATELADATAAARRESAAAFGDDTLLFERYVEHGRHIEVQVIADEHGHFLHLLERDCSVQRRHQKVVEEAPASVISPEVRDLVRDSAVALAREVGYLNAGTVEFLVSGEEAYFLEMNTRLQVEHPVTELVTGLDLVLLQFLVAQGEPLPIRQEDVVGSGHAIEVRVYAEDPYHGYLPQAGVAEVVQWPTGVRVDAALEAGQRVSTFYDPMLGKVVASGATREAARRVLVSALDNTAILGLTTNLGFLRDLADSEQFRRSEVDTSWLDNNPHSFTLRAPAAAWCLAAWSLAAAAHGDSRDPLALGDGWRLGADPAVVSVELTGADGEARRLQVDLAGGALTGPHASRAVRSLGTADGRVLLEIDGAAQAGRVLVRPDEVVVSYRGQTYRFSRPDAFGRRVHARVQDGSVTAPMPGTVLGVSVAVGEHVGEGQPLGVLEAMKMEITLSAPFAGTVTEVGAEAGAQVDLGARLFVVTPAEVANPAPGHEDSSDPGGTR
ncbi:MAG TPA: biotin carboxylase N-terminal domain-containing protein [Nocardioidaceae bacterium]|nr:biotin carboxylase N-terminal domain-containing protein [Nocardioidaceae bacterium]